MSYVSDNLLLGLVGATEYTTQVVEDSVVKKINKSTTGPGDSAKPDFLSLPPTSAAMSAESASTSQRNQVDLVDFVDWSGVECLNQSSSHSLPNALKQVRRL